MFTCLTDFSHPFLVPSPPRKPLESQFVLSLITNLLFEARAAAQALIELTTGPHIRLGVTGLSRAGKTVFITALIEHLTKATSPALRGKKNPLPVFRVHAEGRLISGMLEPQPDDAVPRFAYEDHIAALTGPKGRPGERHWPQSTRRISELRLCLVFDPKIGRRPGHQSLTIDIVDYPGEWLLDLPLLGKSFGQWSREAFSASASAARAPLAAKWRALAASTDPRAKADEEQVRREAELFTNYLRACRADEYHFSSLPPGRFLMPGDLEGSPALTFVPLAVEEGEIYPPGSFAAMMERRYEAYKAHVVTPFFRDHFARLDRQIVVVDALAALNAGPAAMRDLETALTEVLAAFRVGRGSLLSALFRPKIDKILFAAAKADHLHHTSHRPARGDLQASHQDAPSPASRSVGAEVDKSSRFQQFRATRARGHGRRPSTNPTLEATTSSARPSRASGSAMRFSMDRRRRRFTPANSRLIPTRYFATLRASSAIANRLSSFVRFRHPVSGLGQRSQTPASA